MLTGGLTFHCEMPPPKIILTIIPEIKEKTENPTTVILTAQLMIPGINVKYFLIKVSS